MPKIPISLKLDAETLNAATKVARESALPRNRWIENTLKKVLGLMPKKGGKADNE